MKNDLRREAKDKANPNFHLPQSTLERIHLIIQCYFAFERPARIKNIESNSKIGISIIAKMHNFLMDIGILTGDYYEKQLTPKGKELGKVLRYGGTQEEIKEKWQKIILENKFCVRVLKDVYPLGEITKESFKNQILKHAGYANPSRDISGIGANTLIEIFVLAGYAHKFKDLYRFSDINNDLKLMDSTHLDLLQGYEHLTKFLPIFLADHPNPNKNVFLMMRFRRGRQFQQIHEILRRKFSSKGFEILRADDKDYTGDLWDNVCLYMLGCNYGVSVFEEIDEREFNPNVSIELGFMFALRKRCLILKDQRMPKMPTDIIGKLYKQFDTYAIEDTIILAVESWFNDLDFKE